MEGLRTLPYERKLCMCDEPECAALRGAYEPVLGRPGFYWLPLPEPGSSSSPEPPAEPGSASPTADETAEAVSREGSADSKPANPLREPVPARPSPAEPDCPKPEVSDFGAREMTADERRSWNAVIDRQMMVNALTQGR